MQRRLHDDQRMVQADGTAAEQPGRIQLHYGSYSPPAANIIYRPRYRKEIPRRGSDGQFPLSGPTEGGFGGSEVFNIREFRIVDNYVQDRSRGMSTMALHTSPHNGMRRVVLNASSSGFRTPGCHGVLNDLDGNGRLGIAMMPPANIRDNIPQALIRTSSLTDECVST
ncbi:hypothetical protein QBC46DRAFT_73029 [Diplogelasinospora grovesii]|uniref:Uncharacterized protein n=1 Tax=Diplogelasinospora grovesii TaxID=303347 RepID=A0AAN6RYJ9_9PEZI|nr:hypothetical protein QBC46DRAFT_73029 [Diplogelasinospora grovesii]